MWKFLCEHKPSFLWGECLGVHLLGPVIVVWLFLDNHPGCWVGKEMENQTGSRETLGGDAGVQERGDDGLYLDGGSGLGSTRTLRAWR